MQTLERDLMQVKNRNSEQKEAGLVYEAPCKDCSVVYVMKLSGCCKSDRVSTDKTSTEARRAKNVIADYVQKTNHCINWDGVTVQRQVEGFWQRTVEAIQMEKSTVSMNFDSSSPSLKLNPEPARTSHLAPPTFFHIIHIFFIFVIKHYVYFILVPLLYCWMVHVSST